MRPRGRAGGGAAAALALLVACLAAPGAVRGGELEPLVPVEVLLRTRPANLTVGQPFNVTAAFTRVEPRMPIRPTDFKVRARARAPGAAGSAEPVGPRARARGGAPRARRGAARGAPS
jgi:hypothetical protein